MALVQLKCTECGAPIELDDSREFGFCMYCGMKILLQRTDPSKVELDYSNQMKNWEKLCIEAFNHGELDEAKIYCNRIREVDMNNEVANRILALIRAERNENGSGKDGAALNRILDAIQKANESATMLDRSSYRYDKDDLCEAI